MDYQRAYGCRGGRVYTSPCTQMASGQKVRDADGICEYPSLAMVYLPYQKWQDLYNPNDALANGTLFIELDKPFNAGKRGGRSRC